MIHEPYPTFARSERIADGVIHAVGVTLAMTGAILLVVFAAFWAGAGQIAAVSVYGTALIATFSASAFYHMTPWEGLRPTLRRIDHAAIYLKIAGTYTPLVLLIGSGFGYVVLALVWMLALAGAVAKLFFWAAPGRLLRVRQRWPATQRDRGPPALSSSPPPNHFSPSALRSAEHWLSSTDRRNSPAKHFGWFHPIQGLSRAVI